MTDTPSSKGIKGILTREEFAELTPECSQEIRDKLFAMFNDPNNTQWDIEEYHVECSMCGIEMSYRFCGMCTRCEMVWNG